MTKNQVERVKNFSQDAFDLFSKRVYAGALNQVFLSDLKQYLSNQIVESEYFDLSDVIKDAFMASHKNFDLRAQFKNYKVCGDKQVFYNFLMNFIYHCEGELSITVITLDEQKLSNSEKYA